MGWGFRKSNRCHQLKLREKDMEKIKKYRDYLFTHIENVKKGKIILEKNFPELFDSLNKEDLEQQFRMHDLSKYSKKEFDQYADYFYGERTEEVKRNFKYAWLNHIHNNPHHHQYWLLKQDSGELLALEMPYNYIIEMICDWWSFSLKNNDLQEIQSFYEKDKNKMILGEKTRETVEYILSKIATLGEKYES